MFNLSTRRSCLVLASLVALATPFAGTAVAQAQVVPPPVQAITVTQNIPYYNQCRSALVGTDVYVNAGLGPGDVYRIGRAAEGTSVNLTGFLTDLSAQVYYTYGGKTTVGWVSRNNLGLCQ